MNIDLFLQRLYEEGCQNDAHALSREQKMLNITPSTGAFLDVLITDGKPSRILELGTSNGYSTCWLARAATKVHASLDTVDFSIDKSQAAAKNLALCNLSQHVTLHTCDAGAFLQDSSDKVYDFVFLDSDRAAYAKWAKDLIRVTQFGLIVVDNAISHHEQMQDFEGVMRNEYGMSVVTLPIGKGQMIIQRAA